MIFFITLFLAILGFTLSDPFIVSLSPNLTQSMLVIPFLIFSFANYRVDKNDSFIRNLTYYCSIVFIFYSIYGFKNQALLSNLLGTAIIAFAFYNLNIKHKILKYSFLFYLAITTYFAFAYYFGQWVTSIAMRSSFISHDENNLAHIMCVGMMVAFYYYFTEKVRIRKSIYLIISLGHILPIIATVSRTGISMMILTILIFIFYGLNKATRNTVFILMFLAIIVFSSVITILLKQNESINLFFERSSEVKQDDRADFWKIGIEQAKKYPLSGVGFDRFYDFEWRKSIGLIAETVDDYAGINETIWMSFHNSYLDLILVGGVWLLAMYLILIFSILIKARLLLLKTTNHKIKMQFVLIIAITLSILIFSASVQSATQKFTWFLFGIVYLLLYEIKNPNHKILETQSV